MTTPEGDRTGEVNVAAAEDRVDPIHQFHINDLFDLGTIGGMKFSFTNSALFMFVAVALAFLLLYVGSSSRSLVPGRAVGTASLGTPLPLLGGPTSSGTCLRIGRGTPSTLSWWQRSFVTRPPGR